MDGQRLRDLRERHGYSRERFAIELEMGVAQVARYERGENDPTGNVLYRMARFFNVSADYLIGLTDDPNVTAGDLAPKERAAIDAWRRGEKYEAIKAIVGDE